MEEKAEKKATKSSKQIASNALRGLATSGDLFSASRRRF